MILISSTPSLDGLDVVMMIMMMMMMMWSRVTLDVFGAWQQCSLNVRPEATNDAHG